MINMEKLTEKKYKSLDISNISDTEISSLINSMNSLNLGHADYLKMQKIIIYNFIKKVLKDD